MKNEISDLAMMKKILPGETKIWSYNECWAANVITFLCAGIRGNERKRKRTGMEGTEKDIGKNMMETKEFFR